MTKQANKNLTPEEARRAIYLDFEGQGANSECSIPIPHMLGMFQPHPLKGGGGEYAALFFRTDWKAPANGSCGKARLAGFPESMEELINRAESEQRYLAFWSDHERKVIKQW